MLTPLDKATLVVYPIKLVGSAESCHRIRIPHEIRHVLLPSRQQCVIPAAGHHPEIPGDVAQGERGRGEVAGAFRTYLTRANYLSVREEEHPGAVGAGVRPACRVITSAPQTQTDKKI
jgi:hypothetical protein